MRVRIDPTRCRTVGICVRICPEVFRFEAGSKKAVVYRDPIPLDYREDCRKAAEECPKNAIIVID